MFGTKIFGLDISDSSVEALEIQKFFKNLTVKAYSRAKLEPGIVDNGEIIQVEKLAEIIKNLLLSAKPNKISTKNVSLCLPESKIYAAIFKIPAQLKEAQLAAAVNNAIPDILPIEPGSATVSWQVLETDDNNHEILVAAIDNEILKNYILVAEKLNLKIISLEMESLATARAVLDDVKANEAVLILDIGARTTNISIFDDLGLRLTYTAKIAGQNFTEAISREKKMDFIEAEKYKIKDEKILTITEVRKLLDEIVVEIKKSINYFESKSNKVISKGVIVGGSSLACGMPEFLSKALDLKIQLAKPFTKIKNHDIIAKDKEQILFTTVVGLAKKAADNEDTIINFIK